MCLRTMITSEFYSGFKPVAAVSTIPFCHRSFLLLVAFPSRAAFFSTTDTLLHDYRTLGSLAPLRFELLFIRSRNFCISFFAVVSLALRDRWFAFECLGGIFYFLPRNFLLFAAKFPIVVLIHFCAFALDDGAAIPTTFRSRPGKSPMLNLLTTYAVG